VSDFIGGVIQMLLTFVGGIGGWFGSKTDGARGDLLKSRAPVVLSAIGASEAQASIHFSVSLPRGTVVRVERLSRGDGTTRWISPVDELVRIAIVPKKVAEAAAPISYLLELTHDQYLESFDKVRARAAIGSPAP
jgi:hypothetical protein